MARTIKAPSDERNSYVFTGWYDAPEGGSPVTDFGTVTEDAVYYAHFTVGSVSYPVVLNGNGGSGTPLTDYVCGEGATLPADWTRENAAFAGWYDNEDFEGDPVTEIGGGEAGEKRYWARWSLAAVYDTVTEDFLPDRDTVALENGDEVRLIFGVGQQTDPENWLRDGEDRYHMTVTENIEIPKPEERGEYLFAGWDVTDAGGEKTFVAQWLNTQMMVPEELTGQIMEIGSGLQDYAKSTLAELNGQRAASDSDRIQELNVVMTVNAYSEEEVTAVSSENREIRSIADIADGRTLIAYDITIQQTITVMNWDGSTWTVRQEEPTAIRDTGSPITVRVPFDFTGKEDVKTYRFHDTADEFSDTPSPIGEFCTEERGESALDIHARLFSTYAIGYRDAATPLTPGRRAPASPKETGVEEVLNTEDHILCIRGCPDGEVKPGDSITRAETAMFFFRLLKDRNTEAQNDYPDVRLGAWYAEAVRTLTGTGIITGYPDGTFRGDRAITRAEFTAIAMRFAHVTEGVCSFTDVADTFWAKGLIASAAACGWITGCPDGTFRPEQTITRAEAAAIVNRMLGRNADEDYADRNFSSLVQFPDLQDRSRWYFYHMIEATNAHRYTPSENGEIWCDVG